MSHDLRITAMAEKKAENALAKIENKFTIQGGSKLEVFDEDGGKLYEGEFKSFTSNFLKLLYGSMVGAGTVKVKDISGNSLEMNSFPQDAMNISGGEGVNNFGVVVGTNATAVSVSDYNINVPASLTVNDTVVSASSVGGDSISVEISRQIGNSSGSTVNLKEAGLICGEESGATDNVLIARDLLDLTLENGKKSIWRYTINFNFAADKGGFIKTFADKMFSGIFEELTTITNWSGRIKPRVVVFNNKIWVMGGVRSGTSTFYNDVWYSSDGINWTQATSSASWNARRDFGCVVFDNKIWVLGGYGQGFQHDVWYSSNGINWTQATSSASWSGRYGFGCVVFDNKIWVLGGDSGSYNNDVWYSSNGINWTQATSSASWSGRRSGASIVFDNKIWIMGGYNGTSTFYNDVWYSSDGINWTQATSSASWSGELLDERISEIANKMYLISTREEIWASSNGVTWDRISAVPSLPGGLGCSTFKNRIYTIGGDNTNKVYASKMFIVDLRVGSSDNTFSPTGTALGSLIADGSGSSQLVYGAMPGAGTVEPFVNGNKTKFSIAREFANNSGADITVREVGLFSGTDMLARLILAAPVTIANGESEVISVDFETEV